jgi:hypothetical protein
MIIGAAAMLPILVLEVKDTAPAVATHVVSQ